MWILIRNLFDPEFGIENSDPEYTYRIASLSLRNHYEGRHTTHKRVRCYEQPVLWIRFLLNQFRIKALLKPKSGSPRQF
jgi:hypothetical protein